jgi:RNA polymerase sigma-70 factor, ECF subfamily
LPRTDRTPQPLPDRDEAFALFFTHRAMLRAYLHAIVRDADLAEDTLSDVALETARAWNSYNRDLPFGPWVRGIARRVAFKRLRNRSRAGIALPDDVLESLGTALDELGDASMMEARKRQLQVCLDRLNDRNRELVRLRYYEEVRLDAIAHRLGRSLGALYTAFSRIHAVLLACLEKAGDGTP